MEKKLVIQFGNHKIVAEINDLNLPEIPSELGVYICDENDNFIQDVCLVRQSYKCGRNGMGFESDNNSVDCLVWSNPNNEDFTHDFTIGVYEEEDE